MGILHEAGKQTMNSMSNIGKFLIVAGVVIVCIGILLILAPKFPWFAKLPGDIYIQKKNFSLYFPITTSIIISIILTLILYLMKK
jgi:uncharacterized protein HemY